MVSDHFTVIGDVAVIGIHPLLKPYRQVIAQAIVSRRKNIGTVLEKTGKIAGDLRTAGYELLLGNSTVTVHREAGFSYRLDVAGSFFSPRMVSERKRVTGLVRPGEHVFVPFAGIGPYVIPAAARGADVWAVEQNPDAFRWLSENCALNKVGAHCHLIPGDALDTSLLPVHRFDRIIIPAPYGMDNALDILLPLLSSRGTAHFYTFRTRQEIPGLVAAYAARGLDVTYTSACGNVAPGVSRRVFDLVWRR
ncbi:class I SAM-dependent methyltransferase family protein [Methanoregula sp. PtaB.Bin085]|uniref:class I SAM-dependent methyltransferase n=1 Tax=Methanoregula sp. PtaB.Bin085 TaxID=1811680 RepID=UPI0025CED5BC|nr:RsmD family RNA methyltransferase [Methanoregula sp. PtaB.Bin085]